MRILPQGLTFNDVYLVPQYSSLLSRKEANTETIIANIPLKTPIISANMSTITWTEMATAMHDAGGLGILHRYKTPEEIIAAIKRLRSQNIPAIPSVGVKPQDLENITPFYEAGATAFCIDIAHAHSPAITKIINKIHKLNDEIRDYNKNNSYNEPSLLNTPRPLIPIIAGNVATYEGAKYLADYGVNVIKTGISQGCFAAGTRVLMSNGSYKNIEDVLAGDRVINMNGKAATVKRAYCTGIKPVMSVRGGSSVNRTHVTVDHKFLVGDLNSVSVQTIESRGYAKLLNQQSKTVPKVDKIKWKEIGETKRDVALFPSNIEFELPDSFNVEIKRKASGTWRTGIKYETEVTLAPSYDLGYIFGTFLGDGHSHLGVHEGSHIGSVGWSFGIEEVDIAEKLCKSIQFVFGRQAKIEQKENITMVKFCHKPFADFLHSFGKRADKHLPGGLLVNNKEYLKGIYDGLMDSDGCVSNNKVSFTNTSSKLVELFSIISFILDGSIPSIQHRPPTSGGLKNCKLENCRPAYSSVPMKNGKKRQTSKYQAVKMYERSTTNISVPVYELEIDDETHSFIADNMIVHNSVCLTKNVTGHGVPQLTAIMDCSKVKHLYPKVKIIADGSIKSSGDIVKALASGADAVMVGSLLAGTDETPVKGFYSGMASKRAQEDFLGKVNNDAPEGKTIEVPDKGPVGEIIKQLTGGIRSGMSYSGARNLKELQEKAVFMQLTPGTLR